MREVLTGVLASAGVCAECGWRTCEVTVAVFSTFNTRVLLLWKQEGLHMIETRGLFGAVRKRGMSKRFMSGVQAKDVAGES